MNPAGWMKGGSSVGGLRSLSAPSTVPVFEVYWGRKRDIDICSVKGTGKKPSDAVVTWSIQWWEDGTKLDSSLMRGPTGCSEFSEHLDKMLHFVNKNNKNNKNHYLVWYFFLYTFNFNRKRMVVVLLLWIKIKRLKNKNVHQEALNTSIF